MKFSDTDIDAMLSEHGSAVIEDGSTDGLDVYCKFTGSQIIAEELGGPGVEMSDPVAKVRTSAVIGFLRRGLRLSVSGVDYSVKRFEHRPSGMSILYLEDA